MIKRLLILLATCLALSVSGAVAGSSGGDCCKKGYFCCGTKCLPLSKKGKVVCIQVEGGCCDKPPPPKDCCKKGYFCCGDKCVDKKLAPTILCKKNKTFCCDKPDPKPTCKQPAETGPCKALIRRWYYNYKTGKCEKFIYGGCGGNDNNFTTKEKCLKKCSKDGGGGGKDCCRKGYWCCGHKCIKHGKKPWYKCGKSRCCKGGKKPSKFCWKHRHCKHGKYCCRRRCVSKWYAKKKGCI